MSILDLIDDVLCKIISYLNSSAKSAFSLINTDMNKFLYSIIREIGIFAPYRGMRLGPYLLNIPINILVSVIQRYPLLEKINFGFSRQDSFSGTGEFRNEHDKIYLEELILYLNNYPLLNVKKINFREIIHNTIFNKNLTESLNYRLLNSMGHNNLENIKIKAYHIGSGITGNQIQGILEKSPNLKIFKYDGYQSSTNVELSFKNLHSLHKVKLTHWKANESTIETLKECKKLQELIIQSRGTYLPKKIFLNQSWSLKRLELSELSIRSDIKLDQFTKYLSQLECFSITLENISDDGMLIIGKNCPNLKIFQCKNKNLTNLGLHNLTTNLPQLEIVEFTLAYNINEIGIISLVKNCTKLRLMQIIHHKNISHLAFDGIIKHCKDLKAIGFGNGGEIDIEDIYKLVHHIPSLLYVDIVYVNSMGDKAIKNFYRDNTQLKKIPYVSNAYKLRKLVI